jgi:hypothetical protein
VAGDTLAQTQPDDVLGAADPSLVKRWSEVGAAHSMASAHKKRLKRQRQSADAAANSAGEGGGCQHAGHAGRRRTEQYCISVRLSCGHWHGCIMQDAGLTM